MHMIKAKLLILLLLPTVIATAQGLTPAEKKIAEAVINNLPETFSLLEKIVNINSGSMNTKGVRQSGELVRTELDKIGFSTQWIDMPDSLNHPGHLVGMIKGKQGKKLLLMAHLDTVFEPDMPANPYRIIDDSTATGQGILDDKGGDIVILAALQALAKVGALKDVSITVYLTGDEEKGGIPTGITRADITERAKGHDIALSFEAGSLNKVITGRRGADTYTLKTYGKQAHSSGIFSERGGFGAIYEASRILDSFRVITSIEKFLTSNPGIMAAGTTIKDSGDRITVYGKDNIVASYATVTGDIRFLTEAQRRAARIKMQAIVDKGSLPGTNASITFEDGIPSMSPGDANKKLAATFNQVNLDMGLGDVTEVDPMSRGAGDISFIASYITSLDGLGPSGSGAHAPGEILNTRELPLLIQRAAIFMYRLTR